MPELDKKLRLLIGYRVLVVLSIALPYFLYQASVFPSRAAKATAHAGTAVRGEGSEQAGSTAEQALEGPPERPAATGFYGALALDTRQGQALRFVIAFVSIQTLLYIAIARLLPARHALQAYLQFFGDLMLITLLIPRLGDPPGSFSILYLVTISVAAVILRRSAALFVAGGAMLMFSTMLMLLASPFADVLPIHLASSYGPFELLSKVELSKTLLTHFGGFFGVAVLTSYLAQNVARAEEQLHDKHLRLEALQRLHRDIVQSVSSGLITTDLSGRITSLNLSGGEILGTRESEVVGQLITSTGLFDRAAWHRLTHSDQADRRSEVELNRDGETIYIGYHLNHLRDPEGAGRGFSLIFQDLSQHRKMQERLRISDRMAAVGEMAAGLAHEVGNPLAAISGSVQMMAASEDTDPARRKLLEITLRESQRLDRTVKQFLKFATPRERHPTRFDIAKLLVEETALLSNSDEVDERLQITAVMQPRSAMVTADPDQISQIFWNLARNALKAMPEGGTLTVSGRLQDDLYQIEFNDTGSGMTPEERTNLFHPFKSFFDVGSGIGMAIVYRIVEEHGGTIHIDSEPGRGSVIRVDLPAGINSKT